MSDPFEPIRRLILAELAAIDDEYRVLRAATERLRAVENRRWALIAAYEALTPEVKGDARERSETVTGLARAQREATA